MKKIFKTVLLLITLTLVLGGYSYQNLNKENTSPKTENNECTTKKISESGEIFYSIFDINSCYWENHTPLDFLDDLKSRPNHQLTIIEAPKKVD